MGGYRFQCCYPERERFRLPFGRKNIKENHEIWELPLSLETMKTVYNLDMIDLPFISKDEIMDKNGRDALSKTIAMAQLAWFVLQIAARAHQNLAITELELTTAALASLNIAMYISWWSKPTDILCPTIVESRQLQDHIRNQKHSLSTSTSRPNIIVSPGSSCPHDHSATPADNAERYSENSIRESSLDIMMKLGTNVEVNLVYHYYKELKIALWKTVTFPVRSITKLVGAIPGLWSRIGRVRDIFSSLVHRLQGGSGLTPCQKLKQIANAFALTIFLICDTIGHLFLALIYYPALAILGNGARLQFADKFGSNVTTTGSKVGRKRETTANRDSMGARNSHMPVTGEPIDLEHVEEMETYKLIFDKAALRLVMEMGFFCEDVASAPFLCLSAFSGAVFGAIHCTAWNFELPSYVEQLLWRTSSCVIAGLCTCIMVVSFAYICTQINRLRRMPKDNVTNLVLVESPRDTTKINCCGPPQETSHGSSPTAKVDASETKRSRSSSILDRINGTEVVCTAFAVCFVLTRLSLLILSLIGLRALPASAYDTVQWSGFIPHI